MRRLLVVLALAAVMAAMLVVMAAPAMAKGSGGVVKIAKSDRSAAQPRQP